ncbi:MULTISPECIES: Lrp/AsnC ligand binding domain-containing protein [unclassified Exiguobacterium]
MNIFFIGFNVVSIMKTSNHENFIQFLNERQEVVEAHRVSGEGCYHLKIKVTSQEELNLFLNSILEYGNYTLYLSINEIKRRLSPIKDV